MAPGNQPGNVCAPKPYEITVQLTHAVAIEIFDSLLQSVNELTRHHFESLLYVLEI